MATDYTKQGLYQVIPVTPGIVRNLLKTTYFLRIPKQDSDNLQKQSREGQTIQLPPGRDVQLDWRDFDVVSDLLKQLDRDSVVKIIQYPVHLTGEVGVQKDGVTILDPVRFLDFHGSASVTDEGGAVAGITLTTATSGQVEVAFAASDWLDDSLTVIPTGAPAAGQVGPHLLPVSGREYVVSHFKSVDAQNRRPVDMDTFINFSTGFITVRKAPVVPDFSGVLVISVTLP